MPKLTYEQGLHLGQVVEQGLTKAKTGTAQFVLKIKILGVPDGEGSYVAHREQYDRTIYMALTEKTMPYVKENLERLGFEGTSLGQLDPAHAQAQKFTGKQVEVWCKHERDQQGELRERWQISTGGGSLGDPLDQREVRNLDGLFGRMSRPSTPTPIRSEPYGDGTGISDDDIPF